MTKRILPFSLLVIAIVAGCSTLGINIQNPMFSIRDVRPHVAIALPLSASSIDFDFNIGVDNPNPVGLKMTRMDFNLLVNDSHIATGVTNQAIRIPANGTGFVNLRTRVGYNEIRNVFNEVADVIQGNKARYQVNGRAYFDTPAGQMSFPLTVYSN